MTALEGPRRGAVDKEEVLSTLLRRMARRSLWQRRLRLMWRAEAQRYRKEIERLRAELEQAPEPEFVIDQRVKDAVLAQIKAETERGRARSMEKWEHARAEALSTLLRGMARRSVRWRRYAKEYACCCVTPIGVEFGEVNPRCPRHGDRLARAEAEAQRYRKVLSELVSLHWSSIDETRLSCDELGHRMNERADAWWRARGVLAEEAQG